MSRIFLGFFLSPFQQDPEIFGKSDDKYIDSVDVFKLCNYQEIVAYDFTKILNRINKGADFLDNVTVFDIQLMKRIIIGLPSGNFHEGSAPWDLVETLGNESNRTVLKKIHDIHLQKKLFSNFSTNEINECKIVFLDSIEEVFEKLNNDLIEKGEDKRFLDIELPIYNLFLKTQFHGINIDELSIEEKITKLDFDYFKALKEVEISYNIPSQIINAGLTFTKLGYYTKHCNSFEEHYKGSNFWDIIKLLEDDIDLLKNIREVHRSKIDINALQKYQVLEDSRIYPLYHTFGTITGRIQIVDPGIQYLKSTTRKGLFNPSEHSKLLYLDYSQFEAGIVASLTNDEELIKCYNKGDVYEELSIFLFHNKGKRQLAKKIFLAYIYGMKEERIKQMILDMKIPRIKEKTINKVLKKFFDRFCKIESFKQMKIEELKANGRIGTIYGNYRYRVKNKSELSNTERRWAFNHVIQGTASYIFKKAILRVVDEVKNITPLIPMHDALLFEIPTLGFEENKKCIENIFINTFNDICNNIDAKVHFEEF